MWAEPRDACDGLTNKDNLAGTIVLFSGGSCSSDAVNNVIDANPAAGEQHDSLRACL